MTKIIVLSVALQRKINRDDKKSDDWEDKFPNPPFHFIALSHASLAVLLWWVVVLLSFVESYFISVSTLVSQKVETTRGFP